MAVYYSPRLGDSCPVSRGDGSPVWLDHISSSEEARQDVGAGAEAQAGGGGQALELVEGVVDAAHARVERRVSQRHRRVLPSPQGRREMWPVRPEDGVQERRHAVVVGVARAHMRVAPLSDARARRLIAQEFRRPRHQRVVVVERQVRAIGHQRAEAVVDAVGEQRRASGRPLEDAHVDLVAQRAVEDEAGLAVDTRHRGGRVGARVVVEGEALGQAREQGAAARVARTGGADEGDVVAFGHVIGTVNRGVGGQGQPVRLGVAGRAQRRHEVPLRRERVVEEHGLAQQLLGPDMHVDEVAGRGARQARKTARKVRRRARVDVDVKVGRDRYVVQ